MSHPVRFIDTILGLPVNVDAIVWPACPAVTYRGEFAPTDPPEPASAEIQSVRFRDASGAIHELDVYSLATLGERLERAAIERFESGDTGFERERDVLGWPRAVEAAE